MQESEAHESLPPPMYDSSYLEREDPPDYSDALQDVVITRGRYSKHSHKANF